MGATKRQSVADERAEQLASLDNLIGIRTSRIEEVRVFQARLTTIKSVTSGLYDEVDKLCKKAPAESATDLLVGEVNEVISQMAPLATNDGPLQRIKQFVPAGDNPQYRDVVLVLRLILGGIDRLTEQFRDEIVTQVRPLGEMRALKQVLEWLVNGEKAADITPEALKHAGHALPTHWFEKDEYEEEASFDTERLKTFDVKAHFAQ